MSNEAKIAWISAGVGLLGGFLIGILIGGVLTQQENRNEAIKAGVARYTVDPATGITKFEYVKP